MLPDDHDMTFELDEVFDVTAAMLLCRRVAELPADTRVVLDCRRTRHFDGFAFASLVRFLADDARRYVATRGLSQCHQRVLAYLGLGEAVHAA